MSSKTYDVHASPLTEAIDAADGLHLCAPGPLGVAEGHHVAGRFAHGLVARFLVCQRPSRVIEERVAQGAAEVEQQ